MVEAPIVDRMRQHSTDLHEGHAPRSLRIDAEPAPETPGAMVHGECEPVDMVFIDDLPSFHSVTFTSYSEPD
jgi:hypothetical protein